MEVKQHLSKGSRTFLTQMLDTLMSVLHKVWIDHTSLSLLSNFCHLFWGISQFFRLQWHWLMYDKLFSFTKCNTASLQSFFAWKYGIAAFPSGQIFILLVSNLSPPALLLYFCPYAILVALKMAWGVGKWECDSVDWQVLCSVCTSLLKEARCVCFRSVFTTQQSKTERFLMVWWISH